MRSTLAFFVLLVVVGGCYNSSQDPQATNSSKTVTPSMESNPDETAKDANSEASILANALAEIQSGKALLVDVRSDDEWNEAHFETAKHIPIDKITEDCKAAFEGIGTEQTVFIH